jgi:hypothetical protein
MFHHFDVVALKKPLPVVEVPVGATGTVIRVFDWTNPPSYHIHFHDCSQEEAFLDRGDDSWELKISPFGNVTKGRK